jgi:signal transduction histidine kinase
MSDRLDKAVDELDATITEIRSAIFELGESALPGGVRQAVLRLCEELTPALGVRPHVSFHGSVDNLVPPQTADHMLAVVREGLTNAGKYAGATTYEVTVTVGDDICLEIVDNGAGFEPALLKSHGLGLGNMRNRALKLSGGFEVTSEPGKGARLVWRVPIPEP